MKIRPRDLAYSAMGAALIAVCSWISVPTTVPFTLQTFAVFFLLSALGAKRACVSILVYILLGAVGIPVFAGFKGGIGVLLGSTGGYIVGFVFLGLVYWLAVRLLGGRRWAEAAAMLAGLLVCYTFGTLWFMLVYTRDSGSIGFLAVLSLCVFPFILPDCVKLGLALVLAGRVRPYLDAGTEAEPAVDQTQGEDRK